MDRNCKQCRRNKAEKELSCGFLPENERSGMTHTIPTIGDMSLLSNVCPVYTYLENLYLYQFINVAKTMRPIELSFLGRFAIEVYNQYQASKS